MKKIILIMAMLFCLPAHAEWSRQYEFSYAMGDGDTKGSARQAAVEQIKLKASSEAGTYVDSTTTLKEDGSLTESIRMIRATMVRVRVDRESISVSPSGQAILNLVALATLDDAELAKRVAVLRQDKEKARQVKVLQAENQALRASLKSIRDSLAVKADQETVAQLLAKQDQTIRKLDQNGQTVAQVFSQGTLLQLASKNSDGLTQAQRYLDDELYAYLLGVKVSANIETVEQEGDAYTAVIRVAWNVELNKVRNILTKHLAISKYEFHPDEGLTISKYDNENGKGVSNLSYRLYQYLAENAVLAQVSIGQQVVELPVLYGADGFMDACSKPVLPDSIRRELPKSICITRQSEANSEIIGSYQSNPVRISLTKAQAEAATSVSARMRLMDKATADRKREEDELRYRIRREYGS